MNAPIANPNPWCSLAIVALVYDNPWLIVDWQPNIFLPGIDIMPLDKMAHGKLATGKKLP